MFNVTRLLRHLSVTRKQAAGTAGCFSIHPAHRYLIVEVSSPVPSVPPMPRNPPASPPSPSSSASTQLAVAILLLTRGLRVLPPDVDRQDRLERLPEAACWLDRLARLLGPLPDLVLMPLRGGKIEEGPITSQSGIES